MFFNPNKVAFGRHETFILRYGWLTKGLQSIESDPQVFLDDNSTVILGVGKNMVQSIKYWLIATGMAEKFEDGSYKYSNLGQKIFGEEGYDRYIEDEGTIWLIHWLLASNPEKATGFYWFFNYFHKNEFVSEEVASTLIDFSQENIRFKNSKITLKKEANLILHMYGRSVNNSKGLAEETLDSPLSLLGLVSQNQFSKSYKSQQGERKNLPINIFGYALIEYMQALKLNNTEIKDLMYSKEGVVSLGAVFRLSENALITKLEELVKKYPLNFEIRETAGVHQFYILEDMLADEMLAQHYVTEGEVKVA